MVLLLEQLLAERGAAFNAKNAAADDTHDSCGVPAVGISARGTLQADEDTVHTFRSVDQLVLRELHLVHFCGVIVG